GADPGDVDECFECRCQTILYLNSVTRVPANALDRGARLGEALVTSLQDIAKHQRVVVLNQCVLSSTVTKGDRPRQPREDPRSAQLFTQFGWLRGIIVDLDRHVVRCKCERFRFHLGRYTASSGIDADDYPLQLGPRRRE